MPLPKKSVAKAAVADHAVGEPTSDVEPKRTRPEPNKTKQEAAKLKRLKRTPMPKKLVDACHAMRRGNLTVLHSTLVHVLVPRTVQRDFMSAVRKVATSGIHSSLPTSRALDYRAMKDLAQRGRNKTVTRVTRWPLHESVGPPPLQ